MNYHQLSHAQRQQLECLQVLPEQLPYSGDIYCALNTLLVRPSPNLEGFVLLIDDQPSGFFLLKRGDFLPHWAEPNAATLHALQIDHRLQGQGLGTLCLQALPDVVRHTWPEIAQLMLSVDADNQPAIKLYRGQGWVDSGEAYRGRVGFERRMSLGLN